MKTIEECRLEIEKLDSKIVDLLVRRVFTTNEMAEAKKKQGLPIYDQMREDLLRRRIRQLAGTEYEDVISRISSSVSFSPGMIRQVSSTWQSFTARSMKSMTICRSPPRTFR